MSAPPDPLGPTIRYFGDYLLLGEIASGGMGVVYSAQQISLNRAVAVKLIRAGAMATEAERRRFRTEAEASARLDHPNIVPIYEIGTHESQLFVSMKLIEGESLAEKMASGTVGQWDSGKMSAKIPPTHFPTFSPAQPSGSRQRNSDNFSGAAWLVAKIARAVHHAHQRGVLHRDIKPANILIDENDEPHLTDFGLAKLLERDSSQSTTGVVLGTPGYMSPEQATGSTRRLTAASDIYSLGAVLYALLTGGPPFRGESFAETLEQVQKQEPPPPHAINPDADADLETICLRCLEKESNRRYASAAALADDLDRWLRGEPILARPILPWQRLGKWMRRNSLVGVLAAAVVVGMLLAAGVSTWLWQRGETKRRGPSFADDAAEVAWQSVTTPRVQAQPNTSYRIEGPTTVSVRLPVAPATGDVIRLAGQGAGGWRLLQNSNQVILTDTLGAGVTGWVWTRAESGDRQWSDLACSADGTKVAASEFGHANKGGWIYLSADGGKTWKQRGMKRAWTAIASSADGRKLIATAHLSHVYLSGDSGETWTPNIGRRAWTSAAMSADGSKLVLVDNGVDQESGHVYVSTDGGATWTPREENRHWYDVTMSAAGNKLAAVVGQVDVYGKRAYGYLYTSSDGGTNWIARMTDQPRRWASVAMSADGSRLIAAVNGASLYLSTDSGATWRPILDDRNRVWVSVAADGSGMTLLAVGILLPLGDDNGAIYVSHDGGVTWMTRESGRRWTEVAVPADGRILVAAMGQSLVDHGSYIYTSARATVPGLAGSLGGLKGSELTLQYLGADQFRISHASGPLMIEGATVEARIPILKPRR